MVAPDVGEQLEGRRGQHGDTEGDRAESDERGRIDVASEAAWNSLRFTSRKARTAPVINDSSMSAPATRWRKMVPPSRATDTRQARRWPRRMPRPSAIQGESGQRHQGAGGHAGPDR